MDINISNPFIFIWWGQTTILVRCGKEQQTKNIYLSMYWSWVKVSKAYSEVCLLQWGSIRCQRGGHNLKEERSIFKCQSPLLLLGDTWHIQIISILYVFASTKCSIFQSTCPHKLSAKGMRRRLIKGRSRWNVCFARETTTISQRASQPASLLFCISFRSPFFFNCRDYCPSKTTATATHCGLKWSLGVQRAWR